MPRKKYFKILITGSNSYNNKYKLKKILYQIINNYTTQQIGLVLYIGTFGSNYGAESIVKNLCQQTEIKYGEFTPLNKDKTPISILNTTAYNKKYRKGLFYINIYRAYQWFDIALIFTNEYDEISNTLLQLNKKNNNKKEILFIKQ